MTFSVRKMLHTLQVTNPHYANPKPGPGFSETYEFPQNCSKTIQWCNFACLYRRWNNGMIMQSVSQNPFRRFCRTEMSSYFFVTGILVNDPTAQSRNFRRVNERTTLTLLCGFKISWNRMGSRRRILRGMRRDMLMRDAYQTNLTDKNK